MSLHKSIQRMTLACVVFLCLTALTLAAGGPRRMPSSAYSADLPGTIRILPQPAHVDVGETVTMDVWLEGAANVYGIDFKLVYEKANVSIPTGNATPLWEVFDANNHFATRNTVQSVDATHNQLWYSVTNLRPAEPFTGTGRICAITFSGLAAGTAVLDFVSVKASTREGDTLYPTQMDGAILVGQLYRLRLPVVAAR